MSTPTRKFITQFRKAMPRLNSYGDCELCGQRTSEFFVAQPARQYQRNDGSLYYVPVGGGAYGHATCLEKGFAPFNEPYEIQVPEEEMA